MKAEMKTGIDSHCHLEYMEDMEEVAEQVRKRMRGAVCSVPDPKDFDRMLSLRGQFSDCIFVCLGFHPEIAFNYTEKERTYCCHRRSRPGLQLGHRQRQARGDERHFPAIHRPCSGTPPAIGYTRKEHGQRERQ